ncbi:hypothetical protein JW968_02475 [Candidatus Woesearchaeota archaeon]|nr:hypothetical protein [Candidatus Woesearchaeota archaeon]
MKQEYSYLIVVGVVAVVALFIMVFADRSQLGEDMLGYGSRPFLNIKVSAPQCSANNCGDCNQNQCSNIPGGHCGWKDNQCLPSCGAAGGTTFCGEGTCSGRQVSSYDAPEGFVCCIGGCYDAGCDINNCGSCSEDACENNQLYPYCGWDNGQCKPDCYHYIPGESADSEVVRNNVCLSGETDITDEVNIFWSGGNPNPVCCLKPGGSSGCSQSNCYACDPYECVDIEEDSDACGFAAAYPPGCRPKCWNVNPGITELRDPSNCPDAAEVPRDQYWYAWGETRVCCDTSKIGGGGGGGGQSPLIMKLDTPVYIDPPWDDEDDMLQ